MRIGRLALFLPLFAGFSCQTSKIPDAMLPAVPAKAQLLKLDDERLAESSGVAPSRTRPGVYYTHNDSGDTARFFAFSLDKLKLEEYDVENAEAVDWEDMATATVAGRSYVYCGDIGDNKSKRTSIHIYRVREPAAGGGKVRADRDWEISYPDGPHNAETLLVHPGSGDITIVTKSQDKTSGVYFLPQPAQSGTFQLRKIGEVAIDSAFSPARLITGGAISADAKHLVLRTYLEAYEYDASAEWFKSTPRKVSLNHDPQGEGITYSLDGKSLLTTSEGRPCQVSVIPISR